MALNLSTLTNPATSGGILAEALTTADFLDPVPILKNLSRGSNKGGDAKQTVALNQPKALPLIDGDGYLYLSGVNGNCAIIPDESALDVSGDLTLEADVTLPSYPPSVSTRIISKYYTTGNQRSYLFYVSTSGHLGLVLSSTGSYQSANEITSSLTLQYVGISQGQRVKLKAVWRASDGRLQFFYKIKGGDYTQLGTDKVNSAGSIYNGTASVVLGGDNEGTSSAAKAAIHSAKIYASINDTNKVLDVDFTATNVRHGDTKFKCATGQVVTINQDSSSSNDVATIIKKPVLRFANLSNNTTGISLKGLFNQTITDGYMFAAFSVLGDGGEDTSRIFSINTTGGSDGDYQSAIFSLRNNSVPNDLFSYQAGWILGHSQMFDNDNGDLLHESLIKNGTQKSLVNNAGLTNSTQEITTISSEEFNIVSNATGLSNAAIDLEYLALFDAALTTEQANKVRSFINKRNSVFYRWDTDGYYFYDAQKAPVGNITDVNTWSGRIVGSDNGDSASIIAQQATANDQPVGDGYVVTFADNADHLDIPQVTLAAGDSYAWMVCGTSLGTFSYKVTVSGETELNLLGHLGDATYRKAGDLYGIVLLPESATSADIEQARSLLIDRGAADGTSDGSITYYWRFRTDIVDFKAVDMSSATSVFRGWDGCSSMNSFGITQLSNCSNFTNAWRSCSSLQSFPAGAKLGTAASGVNFTSAWRSSGLTSFSTPLPKATVINYAWESCTYLTSFDLESLPLVTNAAYSFEDCTSISSFSSSFYVCKTFIGAWNANVSLADFSADVFANWNPSTLIDGCFNGTWVGCTSLTAQSVENILTSIDASNQHGTDDGTSTGNPLGDSGIDIDYDGTTLSAATTAAVTSLKSKGWVIVVNGVTL